MVPIRQKTIGILIVALVTVQVPGSVAVCLHADEPEEAAECLAPGVTGLCSCSTPCESGRGNCGQCLKVSVGDVGSLRAKARTDKGLAAAIHAPSPGAAFATRPTRRPDVANLLDARPAIGQTTVLLI